MSQASTSIQAPGLTLYRQDDLFLCFGSQWAMLKSAIVTDTTLSINRETSEVCDSTGHVTTRIIFQPVYDFTITGRATAMEWIKNPPSITENMTVRELLQAVNKKLEKRGDK